MKNQHYWFTATQIGSESSGKRMQEKTLAQGNKLIHAAKPIFSEQSVTTRFNVNEMFWRRNRGTNEQTMNEYNSQTRMSFI